MEGSEFLTGLASPLPAGQGNSYPLLLQPTVMVEGSRRGGEIAKVTQRRRISSVSPELALHLFQAAKAPVSREHSIAPITDPSTRLTHHP